MRSIIFYYSNTGNTHLTVNSIQKSLPSTDLWDRIIPAPKEAKIRKDFGRFQVKSQKCSTCGVCADNCPEGAVLFDNSPQFQMDRCTYCYRCFNLCPQKAISTSEVSAEYSYPGPGKDLKEMFL